MNFTKTMFVLAIGSVGIMDTMSAHAVELFPGYTLSITAGVQLYGSYGNVTTGSYFAMDLNGDSKIQGTEKTPISMGTTGITIGKANTALGEITAAWPFGGATGYDWVSTAITGGTSGLDFSGWMVNWNGGDIYMGSGAWTPLNTVAAGMAAGPYASGVGKFSWDGVFGSTYTLDYTATVLSGGFGGTQYALHLEGCVPVLTPSPGDCGYVSVTPAIPEASTYAMMLAGLGLVGFMARRRKQVAI